jgi:hypothetical protein
MRARLRLLVPGLLGPLPAEAQEWEALRQPLPALQLLFARGRRESRRPLSFYELIRAQFTLSPAVEELPAGALGLLGEGGEPGAAHWLRADPVHLRPERDHLMLFDASALQIDAAEAASLVAECNRLLGHDGLELRTGASGCWYLRSEQPIELTTAPTRAVHGHNIDPHLPHGADARRWIGLLTELQMLLHSSSVNLERESRGQPPINGIWIWGTGGLPARVQGSWSRVYAQEPTLRGLAASAGIPADPAPETAPTVQAEADELALLEAPDAALRDGDLQGWWQALAALERAWLAPLLDRLRAGQLDELALECEGAVYRLDGKMLRRFWRRPQPLLRELDFQKV